MKRAMVLVLAVILMLGAGVSAQVTGSLTIAGSTSVQPLADELAAAFMAKNRGVRVSVQGGGSGAGIKSATEGTADIGMSSRHLRPEESAKLVQTIVAKDGIAVIVHKSNPVSSLSTEQVRQIYSGSITNWSQVAGPSTGILVITREEGSGTRGAFEELVMGNTKIAATANVQNSGGAVVASVGRSPAAIGYVSIGSLTDDVKAVKIDGVEPSSENVMNGVYKMQRPFIFLTKSQPTSLVKAFIDFCLSPEGQAIVALDYVRVR